MVRGFCPGAVMLTDALYCNYFLIATLMGAALYARRWNVELDLRNLKTTTGMDVLNCPWLKVARAHARRKIKIHGHNWEPK